MKLKDVKLFCRICNKEIPLSVFQKTGIMGLHDQFIFIPENCDTCIKDKLANESEEEKGITN
jgi:hypothetical protein